VNRRCRSKRELTVPPSVLTKGEKSEADSPGEKGSHNKGGKGKKETAASYLSWDPISGGPSDTLGTEGIQSTAQQLKM